jgi:hypothetical protein
VNRLFSNIGNSRNVYELSVLPKSPDSIVLRFHHKNVLAEKFEFEFERTCQILSLLKPPFLDITYVYDDALSPASVLKLMECAGGKSVTALELKYSVF